MEFLSIHGLILHTKLHLILAIVGLAALGFAESKFKSWSEEGNSHGWSNIVCWIGCAAAIVASVFVIILVCVTPLSGGRQSKSTHVHYVGNTNPTYQHDYKYRY